MSTLRRVLGYRTATSTSAGLAFAAINFLAAVQVAGYMLGDGAWIALVIAGALCLLSAANFSELNGVLPSAAGIRVWTRQGIGDRFSLTFTLVYLTTILAVIAADSFVLGTAIQAAIPGISGFFWICAFLLLTLAANLRGVKVAGLVQDLTTYLLLLSLAAISVMVLVQVHHPFITPFSPRGNLFEAVAVGVFIFVGFEWVTPLAEEMTDTRAISRGMFTALGLIAVAFGLFMLAMTHLLGDHALGTSLVPQLLIGRAAFGDFGFWWMLLVTVITAGTTFNGSFVSASRLLYAMSRERTLPAWFGRLNQRFVPANALLALFSISVVLAAVVYLSRLYQVLIYAGSSLEAIMYVVAALAVLGLQRRLPDAARSFHLPFGKLIPLVTIPVFGILALGAVTATAGLPGNFPWTVPLLLAVAVVAILYVFLYAPRLKRAGTGAGGVSSGSGPQRP
ncbi:MAG: APC family permease [Sulfobacillus sp.]